ncbi:hypothetical protein C8J57DRAFT_1589464 [Mycena rebaudengoi]|nr:hypothetical protein C8J57DRAFT_1589464 [Mycena rebaudengoi]
MMSNAASRTTAPSPSTSMASNTPAYPTLNPSSGAKWIKRRTQDRLGQFVGGNLGDVDLGAALFLEREDGTRPRHPRAFTHIAADYIQHNPFELDGITSSFDCLYPIFSNTSRAVQILHRVFEAPYGWLHYRVDGILQEPTAILDLFRFNGTCAMQEHWDVIQERPVNATNPHPLF